jgi:hypothetical protein
VIGKGNEVTKQDQFDRVADQTEHMHAHAAEVVFEPLYKLLYFDGFTVLYTVADTEKTGPDNVADLLK